MARGSRKRRLHRESRVRKERPTVPTTTFWDRYATLPTTTMEVVRMMPTWPPRPSLWDGADGITGVIPLPSSTYIRRTILEDPDGTQE